MKRWKTLFKKILLFVGSVKMSNLVGSKLKLLNALDTAAANEIATSFTIELVLTKSKRKEVKCGAIAVFRINEIKEINFEGTPDPIELLEAKKELNNMTDRMYRDPEYFRESEGKWLQYALTRVLEIFDELGTDADVVIKSPRLKIRHMIARREIVGMRSDPKKLFWVAFDIDRLLDGKFAYDPWRKLIRRGDVGAAE